MLLVGRIVSWRLLWLSGWLAAAALPARAQQRLSRQQEKNLVAFARLFGYVRYFHPSDEAQTVAWPLLATKGSRQMLAVRNDAELVRALNNLFQPLGPTIQVFPTARPVAFDPAALQPPAAVPAGRVVSWQHSGINTGNYSELHNVRLGRPATETATYSLLKNVAVRQYAGLPYEVELTWSRVRPDDGQGLTFAVAHRQLRGGIENRPATQRYLHQTLTAAGKHYLFRGTIDTAARQLEAALVVPAGFRGNLQAKVFVLAQGQRVELASQATEAAAPAHRQVVELVFTSPDLLAKPLFKEQSQLGDYVARKLVPGISCTVPLALAASAAHTYPVGDSLALSALHVQSADRARYPAEWGRYQGERIIELPEVRLANVVEGWNALRHGYAYWASASVPPDTLLRQTLRRAYADNSAAGFQRTLQRMLAALNDGHAWVTTAFAGPPGFSLPVLFGKVQGQVVVLRVQFPKLAPQLRPGDIVVRIDGVPAEKILRDRASLISGSPQTKEFLALLNLADSPHDRPARLTLRRGRRTQTVRLPRIPGTEGYYTGSQITLQRANGWLAPGIYYYDFATRGAPFGPEQYAVVASAKAIIFDVRGYPGDVYKLIPMLLPAPDSVALVSELAMLRPDQEGVRYLPQLVHYAPSPQHLAGKMYFLTDAPAQSHSETFLGLLRGLHLGTFVGRPTSGANGARNKVALQGGYTIGYSSERVLNADGSRHHTIGIQPDVLVTPTLQSVRRGEDIILTTALKLAQTAP